MEYTKQTWVDGTTPIDAEHMNHIEDGIFGVSNRTMYVSVDELIPNVEAVFEARERGSVVVGIHESTDFTQYTSYSSHIKSPNIIKFAFCGDEAFIASYNVETAEWEYRAL